jgi:uncharacterized protein (DUF1697 family)
VAKKKTPDQRYFAFLRAINVGGRRVKKDDLSAPFEALGLEDVSTFIASGNLSFLAPSGDEEALEKRIEAALKKSLGFHSDTFLRNTAEVKKILKQKPFGSLKLTGDDVPQVGFLKKAPTKKVAAEVAALSTEDDLVAIVGRELFWTRRVPFARSSVAGGQLEKALGQPTTIRNLNTLQRMLDKFGG